VTKNTAVEMDGDAEEMKRQRGAAEQPLADEKINLDDRPIEMIVAPDVEQVGEREAVRVVEPVEIVVEQVADDGRAIDDDGRRDDQQPAACRAQNIRGAVRSPIWLSLAQSERL
jgi:predicted subunit of tRNA(5-methylaminomethyl-2-thiouridylate) methyltransferase